MWNKFIEAVGQHFRFLETEFGFTRTLTKPPIVVFESGKLRLILCYDENRGNELDLGIRRISDHPQRPLSLGIGMLMRFKNGLDTEGYPLSCPSTDEAVEAEVKRLAEHLLKYGLDLLRGDLRDFKRLEQIEKELAQG